MVGARAVRWCPSKGYLGSLVGPLACLMIEKPLFISEIAFNGFRQTLIVLIESI